jgi:hypothetical protein
MRPSSTWGLAQLQLKSYAEAKSTFASIPGTSLVPPVLHDCGGCMQAACPLRRPADFLTSGGFSAVFRCLSERNPLFQI